MLDPALGLITPWAAASTNSAAISAASRLWEQGPGLDPAPRHVVSHGLGAVPTWFVRTDDLIQARSDEVVTLTELQALDPLIGTATFFTETLHPAESAKPPLLVINAEGTLADGRFFSMHVTLNESNDLRRVRTTFGH